MAHGQTKLLLKKKYESLQHVLVKAIIWKLFQPDYNATETTATTDTATATTEMQIELDIGDPNYLPDVVLLSNDNTATANTSNPLFWGESGRMSVEKAIQLCQRYPTTHFVHMRWGIPLQQHVDAMAPAIQSIPREHGRFTLATIPNKNVWDFFDSSGNILITKDDVEWYEI